MFKHSHTCKLRNQKQVKCGVTQGFDTKLYLFLQLDKLVNLSSYKTKLYFSKSFVAYLQRKLNKFICSTNKMVLNILAPNDGFLLITTLKLNTFKVIQSSLHYKRGRGYENLCIYSLIVVGELEPF